MKHAPGVVTNCARNIRVHIRDQRVPLYRSEHFVKRALAWICESRMVKQFRVPTVPDGPITSISSVAYQGGGDKISFAFREWLLAKFLFRKLQQSAANAPEMLKEIDLTL